jgi:FO synthase
VGYLGSSHFGSILSRATKGEPPSPEEALALLTVPPSFLKTLMAAARRVRDASFPAVTYSRNAFLPLTTLCLYACGYCTFFKLPGQAGARFMGLDEVEMVARRALDMGCSEALFTLGERPELLHPEAREYLTALGYSTTNDYLAEACRRVVEGTLLLPHSNPGFLTEQELRRLRDVNASMGLMLETTSTAPMAPGGPHHRCGTKHPRARLATMEAAGRLRIPWTTGLLVGIGETPHDRAVSLDAIRQLHGRHGHIQEVIIQPFTPHPGTPMVDHPPPTLDELLRTIAVARLSLPPDVSLQAPPNLAPGSCPQLLRAGVNDWGGVSPLTIDYVNPTHPWPAVEALQRVVGEAGLELKERLPIYPRYALDPSFHHGALGNIIENWIDDEGLAARGPRR